MEIIHYRTPKRQQKMKLDSSIIVDKLKEFFYVHTNNQNILFTYDLDYRFIRPNINIEKINKNSMIIEENLKITKKIELSDEHIRYEFEIDEYNKVINILMENELHIENIYMGHCFDFLRYDYYKILDLPLEFKENKEYFNRVFIALNQGKSRVCSFTLNIPILINSEEREYIKSIEKLLQIKFSEKYFYLISKNKDIEKWEYRRTKIII